MNVRAKQSGVKPARQARSVATHDAILEAAHASIREHGPDEFTLADVVERAGLTTGAIYSRFKDKDALLFALYEHLTARWTKSLERGYAAFGASRRALAEDLAALFAAQIKVRRQDWRLRNAFLARIVSRADFRGASARMIGASAELFADALKGRREFNHADIEDLRRRTGFVVVMAGASIERAIAMREARMAHGPRDDAALASMLATSAEAVLRADERR